MHIEKTRGLYCNEMINHNVEIFVKNGELVLLVLVYWLFVLVTTLG